MRIRGDNLSHSLTTVSVLTHTEKASWTFSGVCRGNIKKESEDEILKQQKKISLGH